MLVLSLVLALCVPSPPAAAQAAVRETVAENLNWPVSVAIVPETVPGFPAGAILFNERITGNLRVLVDGILRPDPVVSVAVEASGEQGLLGLALDPDWAASPWAYAYHTYFNASLARDSNRVVRFGLGEQPPRMEVVLDGIPAGFVHNGGILGFAPDATLFITTGDAQDMANSQDNGTLAGKILRVNRDGTIPTDNPIPGSPVYSLGHRNVFGLAFHPVTGTPYISENGPSGNDEVNLVEPGRNYGWPIVQGGADDPRFVDPILTFTSTIAPTNLAFYTGANASLRNALFLGDWNRGVLQRIELAPPDFRDVASMTVADTLGPNGILDVEMGPDGHLYVSTPNAIYRLIAPADGPLPPSGVPAVLLVVLAVIAAAVVLIAWGVIRQRRGPPPR